jgi:hypothetical protein
MTLVGALFVAMSSTAAESSKLSIDNSTTDEANAWLAQTRSGPDLRWRILLSAPIAKGYTYLPGPRVAEPVDRLLEATRGNTDPLVLELLLRRCGVAPVGACDRVAVARRWVEADTQNQRAWLALADEQRRLGDADAARESFVRGARASAWHEQMFDLERIIEHDTRDIADPKVRGAVLQFGQMRTMALIPGWDLSLNRTCFVDGAIPEVRSACLSYAATIDRDGESGMTIAMSPMIAARVGADDSTIAAYQRRADATQWALGSERVQHQATASGDFAAKAEALSTRMRQSDRLLAESVLFEEHVTATEAAERLIAAMTPTQKEHRAMMLALGRRGAPAGTSQ